MSRKRSRIPDRVLVQLKRINSALKTIPVLNQINQTSARSLMSNLSLTSTMVSSEEIPSSDDRSSILNFNIRSGAALPLKKRKATLPRAWFQIVSPDFKASYEVFSATSLSSASEYASSTVSDTYIEAEPSNPPAFSLLSVRRTGALLLLVVFISMALLVPVSIANPTVANSQDDLYRPSALQAIYDVLGPRDTHLLSKRQKYAKTTEEAVNVDVSCSEDYFDFSRREDVDRLLGYYCKTNAYHAKNQMAMRVNGTCGVDSKFR